jgi:hypothetical protein
MMSKRVSLDDLEVASLWLDANEAQDDQEGGGCRRVAEWIREEIADRLIRSSARANGVSIGAIKAKLREQA